MFDSTDKLETIETHNIGIRKVLESLFDSTDKLETIETFLLSSSVQHTEFDSTDKLETIETPSD